MISLYTLMRLLVLAGIIAVVGLWVWQNRWLASRAFTATARDAKD
jgi:hypothetical protein